MHTTGIASGRRCLGVERLEDLVLGRRCPGSATLFHGTPMHARPGPGLVVDWIMPRVPCLVLAVVVVGDQAWALVLPGQGMPGWVQVGMPDDEARA